MGSEISSRGTTTVQAASCYAASLADEGFARALSPLPGGEDSPCAARGESGGSVFVVTSALDPRIPLALPVAPGIFAGMLRFLFLLLLAASARAADIAEFAEVNGGRYQVLAQGGEEIGRQVNGYMNALLQLYSRYFSNWNPKDSARVVVFGNLADFRAYSRDSVGVTHNGVAGYCHLKTDAAGNTFYELVAFEYAGLWSVLAHEGFHQFLGHELGEEIPVWLNEGLAQYFENSLVKNGQIQPGQIDRAKLLTAQKLIQTRQLPAVAELLAMDRATFYGRPEVTYPASWALVHYLMNREGTGYQQGRFRRYLQDLKWNKNDVASFRKRFGQDSPEWETDFRRYVMRLAVPAEK